MDLNTVKWTFKDNRQKTKVRIIVYPHLLINWPKFFSYLPYKFYIIPQLRRYLKLVLYGLKQYVEEDKIIEKNIQVDHPWFS